MKVAELEHGMMLEPAGDQERFLRVSVPGTFPYITVRYGLRQSLNHSAAVPNVKHVMYVGTRKELNVSMAAMTYSARYVLYNDELTAVDPAAWRRMRAIQ